MSPQWRVFARLPGASTPSEPLPQPPSPTPLGYPYVGACMPTPSAGTFSELFDTSQQQFNGMAMVRTFSSGSIGTWTSGEVGITMQKTAEAGRRVGVAHSWKTWQESCADLRAWCLAKPDDGRVAYLTYHHEPENDFTPETSSEALAWRVEYRRRQRVARTAIDDVGRDDIRFIGTLMNYTANPASGRSIDHWWPGLRADGRPVWDEIHWDAYNGQYKNDSYGTPAGALERCIAIARGKGVPWGVGEWGSPRVSWDTDGKGRAAYMRAYLDYCLAAGDCSAVLYWSNVDPRTGYDSSIHTDPVAVAALRPYCEASRAAHGITYP